MRSKYARAPTVNSSKLPPEPAARLAMLIREHGHGGAAARLKVSPALVDKLADGGPALPDSVRRMTEALHRMEEQEIPMGKKVAKKTANLDVVMQATERVIEKLDEVSVPSNMNKVEYQELLQELAGAIEARLDCVNDELKEEQG